MQHSCTLAGCCPSTVPQVYMCYNHTGVDSSNVHMYMYTCCTPDNRTPDNSTPNNSTPDNSTLDNSTPDNSTFRMHEMETLHRLNCSSCFQCKHERPCQDTCLHRSALLLLLVNAHCMGVGVVIPFHSCSQEVYHRKSHCISLTPGMPLSMHKRLLQSLLSSSQAQL